MQPNYTKNKTICFNTNNLATEIKASSNSDYLEFSSLNMLNYGIPDGTSSVSQTLTCNSNIYTSEIRVKFTIYHERLKNLIINLIGPNGKILNILNCLHKNDFVHFDLKLENIVIDTNGTLKLIDAGTLIDINESNFPEVIVRGTNIYMAPELKNILEKSLMNYMILLTQLL